MELWIRSQNKQQLVKVDTLYVSDEKNEGRTILGCNLHYTHECLGTYKTKERALEVLDEIQKILKPQLIIKDSGKIIGSLEGTIIREGAKYETKELATYVYEMPKE